jgi:hypothetical protein
LDGERGTGTSVIPDVPASKSAPVPLFPPGLDTHLRSNHDLGKEAVTLFWHAALD